MKKTFIFYLSFIVAFVQVVLLGCKYPIGHCNTSANIKVILPKNYTDSYIIKGGVVPKYKSPPSGSDFNEFKPLSQKSVEYWVGELGDREEVWIFLKNNITTHMIYSPTYDSYAFELGGSSNPNAHYKFGEDWNYVFYLHIFDKDENLLETLVHSITIPYDKSYYVRTYFCIETKSLEKLHCELFYDISYEI